MTEISRIEFAICKEDGEAFEWMDDRSAAISFAASQPEPCYVEERIEYFIDKRTIWASHGSMIEAVLG